MKSKIWVVGILTIFTGLVFAASVESLNWQRLYTFSHEVSSDDNDETDHYIIGMSEGGGKIVAVMANGDVLTSANHVDWTSHEISPKAGYNIVYGSGHFVTLTSDDADPYYSVDGVTWQPGLDLASAPFKINANELKFSNDRFIILGSSTVGVSTTGIQWQRLPLINTALSDHDSEGDEMDLYPLLASSTGFVAFGTQLDGGVTYPALYSSVDGQSWSPVAAAAAPGHLEFAGFTSDDTGFGPVEVNKAGFIYVSSAAISPDGQRVLMLGRYAKLGTYGSEDAISGAAFAASANGGASWTVTPLEDLPISAAFGEDEDALYSLTVAFWNGRFVAVRNYDFKTTVLPLFASADGVVWSRLEGVQVGDRTDPPAAPSYIDSMLIGSDGLYAATSYYPRTNLTGTSDDLEFVTISHAAVTAAPVPTATGSSAAKIQIESKLAKLQKQLKAAKKIADKELSAKKQSKLKAQIKKLKKQLKKLG